MIRRGSVWFDADHHDALAARARRVVRGSQHEAEVWHIVRWVGLSAVNACLSLVGHLAQRERYAFASPLRKISSLTELPGAIMPILRARSRILHLECH